MLFLFLTLAGEFKLNISNCAKVQIRSEAFANTEFYGHFENIPDLQLDERAFSNSSAKVTIQDSRMTQVERLDAILKEIKFSNTHIGTIRSHAFDAYSIDSIIFDKCDIERIESNAFPEKVRILQLILEFSGKVFRMVLIEMFLFFPSCCAVNFRSRTVTSERSSHMPFREVESMTLIFIIIGKIDIFHSEINKSNNLISIPFLQHRDDQSESNQIDFGNSINTIQ